MSNIYGIIQEILIVVFWIIVIIMIIMFIYIAIKNLVKLLERLKKEEDKDLIEKQTTTIYKLRYGPRGFVHYKEFKIECKGTGLRQDPIIIEPSINIPQIFEIQDSQKYIIIENLKLRYLGLKNCRNLMIKECTLNHCFLDSCTSINFENSLCLKKILLQNSNNISLDSCLISILSLSNCFNSHFIHCDIKKVRNYESGANFFEGNEIPERQLNKLKRPTSSVYNILSYLCLITEIAIIILLIYAVIIMKFNTGKVIVLIVIISGIFLLGYIFLIFRYEIKKIKEYEPNTVI